jgi:hypothetical protein
MTNEPFTRRQRWIVLLTWTAFVVISLGLIKCYENHCAKQSQAEYRLRQQAWKGQK